MMESAQFSIDCSHCGDYIICINTPTHKLNFTCPRGNFVIDVRTDNNNQTLCINQNKHQLGHTILKVFQSESSTSEHGEDSELISSFIVHQEHVLENDNLTTITNDITEERIEDNADAFEQSFCDASNSTTTNNICSLSMDNEHDESISEQITINNTAEACRASEKSLNMDINILPTIEQDSLHSMITPLAPPMKFHARVTYPCKTTHNKKSTSIHPLDITFVEWLHTCQPAILSAMQDYEYIGNIPTTRLLQDMIDCIATWFPQETNACQILACMRKYYTLI